MSLKNKINEIAKKLKTEVIVYKNVFKDKRTPLLAKFFFALGIGYLMLPFDLIPDFIPVIGHLDDAVLVPFFIYLALKFTPSEIVKEHRNLLQN